MALWILLSRNLGRLDGEKIISSLHYLLAPTPTTFRTHASRLSTARSFLLNTIMKRPSQRSMSFRSTHQASLSTLAMASTESSHMQRETDLGSLLIESHLSKVRRNSSVAAYPSRHSAFPDRLERRLRRPSLHHRPFSLPDWFGM